MARTKTEHDFDQCVFPRRVYPHAITLVFSREHVTDKDRVIDSAEAPAVEVPERSNEMSRNLLYMLIGLLAAGVLVVGYLYYQESQSGIDIEIGEQGITIEGN
jgi:hypothetical protein